MYKQIGFMFDTLDIDEQRYLGNMVNNIIKLYSDSGDEKLINAISAPTGKRSTHRVRVFNEKLPPELQISIWFLYQNRFRKCLIKDISESGAGVILPFKDMNDLFKMDRPFSALIEVGDPLLRTFVCKSIIRYDRELNPPPSLQNMLDETNRIIHPRDKDFIPSQQKNSVTINYSEFKWPSKEDPYV